MANGHEPFTTAEVRVAHAEALRAASRKSGWTIAEATQSIGNPEAMAVVLSRGSQNAVKPHIDREVYDFSII